VATTQDKSFDGFGLSKRPAVAGVLRQPREPGPSRTSSLPPGAGTTPGAARTRPVTQRTSKKALRHHAQARRRPWTVWCSPSSPRAGRSWRQMSPSKTPRTPKRAAGQKAWDQIVRSMARGLPGRGDVLAGRFGGPSRWQVHAHGSRPQRIRSAPKKADGIGSAWSDDVHLCPAGWSATPDAVLADLSALFHLPPAQAGWSDQSWVNDPRYNTPPGSCPATIRRFNGAVSRSALRGCGQGGCGS